jgi:hypothetical protein
MTCKGICIRHKASGRYFYGHKRCQQCEIFIKMGWAVMSMLRVQIKNGTKSLQVQDKVKRSKTNGAS